jgi:hypothetical protein
VVAEPETLDDAPREPWQQEAADLHDLTSMTATGLRAVAT